MISYELAKQLKEAGFPKSENWFQTMYYCNADYSCSIRTSNIEDTKEPCTCGWFGWKSYEVKPEITLSELIEACGEKFSGLLKIQGSNRWFRAVAPGGFLEVDGPSPEEAVAKLWLAIKK